MDPLLIVLLGMAVVLGGILLLRWHAFLALTAAAFVVAGLPADRSAEDRTAPARQRQLNLARAAAGTLVVETPWNGLLLYRAAAARDLASQAEAILRANPYFTPVGKRVASGFGDTCGSIGILIAMASIVGQCLLDSGAADRIVRALLRLLGEARAALSFLLSGFLLGIPVFFDTVFYLMVPLGKALHLRTGRNYLLYILGIVAGATMAHSLVPPTPGPLFVANRLGVDLATMILAGSVVGLITATVGFLFALWLNRRVEVPLRSTDDAPLERLRELTSADDRQLPPLWLALAPILLPVVLITGVAVVEAVQGPAGAMQGWRWWLTTLGDPTVALALSAAIALGTVVWRQRGTGKSVAPAVTAALASAGSIILITGAGGAFGAAIQGTGIGPRIRELFGPQLPLLPVAFFVTVLIRTAQGSATVAMFTAVGVVAALYTPGALDFHPVYLALAIGCGSKPFQWMNDSGFWVITRMSGLTESEALRTVTPMSALMGFTGLGVIVLGAAFVPLI